LKKLIYIFFTLITSLSTVSAYSQTGKLDISVSYYIENVTIQLFQNDVLIDEYQLDSYEDEFVKTLNVGSYKLTLITEDSASQTLSNVLIKESLTTDVYFSLPDISYYNPNDTNITSRLIPSAHFLIGNNFINNNDNFNTYYDFGFKQGGVNVLTKHLSLGWQIGSSMNYTYFNKSHSLSSLTEFDNEKYYYWNLNFTLLSRLTTFDYKRNGNQGPYLDLGISYNFPLLFRHVITEDNTKISTKRIHNYNDFSTTARLGYSMFALTLEYRLTNFLKENYPEQPKIKIGLSIFFVVSSGR
jgi:hypothetical protein